MSFNVECINPDCGSESAFFNGVCYECPECDKEWGEFGIDDD